METGEHRRRVHYSGTHPKAFTEKYKEQNPEKYAQDVAKVMDRGATPAGMHRSICVAEILDFLQVQPGQIGLDATLGYGGHSTELLKALEGRGHLYATDVDALELPRTRQRLLDRGFGPEIFTALQMNFAQIDQVLAQSGPLNFVLADLGVSSMQIDNPERGFSFKAAGPLDLRLDQTKGQPASELLKTLSRDELQGILMENGDEPHAAEIADAVMAALAAGTPVETTTALREIIRESLQFLPKSTRDGEIKKACQRCFQALRIDVNHEFEVLYDFLDKLPHAMAPGGRVAILSFHSGEDRLVKKSFQQFFRAGLYSAVAPDPIRPSPQECGSNPRARSAKLRWAICP
ncbi:MAG: 16S rRNA (cytosine(1402)-N(4))-methyltransferase RsmH [Pseudoflavonifractor sp.]